MIRRPCLDCGTLHSNQSRCSKHRQQARGRFNTGAYNDPLYKRNRERLLTDHIRRFGHFCPGAPDIGHPPHPSPNLTADHIISLSAGGTHAMTNLRVLCQAANTAKGGTNRYPTGRGVGS